MKSFIEHVMHHERLVALILRANYHSDGIAFFTPDSCSQQLAYIGDIIPAHEWSEF